MTKKKQWLVTATYQAASEWVLDRDLDDAHHWYVKYDRLEVQWDEGGSFETYYPDYPASENFCFDSRKRPEDVTVEEYA